MGERKKQSRLMKKVVATKSKLQLMVNHKALLAEIIPAGISRMAVLGFFASKLLSR